MADKGLYSLLIDIRANIANLQRDMDSAAGAFRGLENKIQDVGKRISKVVDVALGVSVVVAAAKATQAVAGLGRAFVDLAEQGNRAGAILENFERLGGSSGSIEKARKAILGTVSAFDLMRVANEGMLKGIPRLNENFAQMAEFANKFADATGRDTLGVLNELTTALSTGASKSLKQFGFELQQGATNAQNQAAALEQLGARLNELAPLGASVTQGQEAFSAALSEAVAQIGIGINNSEGLTEAYNALAEAVRSVDWKQVGEAIGFVAGEIGKVTAAAVRALQPLAQLITDFKMVAATAELSMLRTDQAMLAARKALNVRSPQTMIADATGIDFAGSASRREAWERENASIEAEMRRINERIATITFENTIPALLNGVKDSLFGGSSGGSASVSSTAAAVESAGRTLNTTLAKDRVEKEIAAQKQIDDFRTDSFTNEFAILATDPVYVESAGKFGKLISDGLFGELKSQSDGFMALGGLIAQGIAAIFGNSPGMTTTAAHAAGIQGPGGAGGWFDTIAGAAGAFLGSGMSTSQAHAAGIQGPGMADGSFGGGAATSTNWGSIATTAIGVADVLRKDYGNGKQGDSQKAKDAIHTVGMAVANAWTFGLASVVEGLVGRENMEKLSIGVRIIDAIFGEHAETTARKAFDRWIEGALEDKDVSFFNRDGQLTRFGGNFETQRFTEVFNKPDWADEFTKSDAFPVFDSLGKALKEMLGITEDIGGQIGFILHENLAGNIDNARLLVKALGLSFEEIEEKMVAMGLKGEKTWLEIETGLQGVSEAFKPGLVAVGDYGQAMENLMNSGGRGFQAVQAIRDMAIEASEAGITNFEQLREQLLKTFDPAVVDAFFAGLEQRGINSIEAMENASDRTAGGVVADMAAAGVKFEEVGERIGESTKQVEGSIGEATSAINELTNAIENIKYPETSAPAIPEPEEKAYATGGLVFGPTRALMGEAGPEAILPLTRKNGRLGVALHGGAGGGGGSPGIYIDARNAAHGTAGRLRSVARDIEDRVHRSVMRSMRHSSGRTT